jgi:hypothetical protein
MPNPVLGTLTAEVSEEVTIMASARALIEGFQSRLEAAVAAAIANGATETELQPLNDLVTALDTEGNALAAAVQANTPAQP